MNKKTVLAVIAVFIVWAVLDMIIHGYLLMDLYVATATLWRPEAEMKLGLMYLVSFIIAVCFVIGYQLLVSEKSVKRGLSYGLLVGLIVSLGMGFASYSYMPIPLAMAVGWFLGKTVEFIVAGWLTAYIVGQEPSER